MKTMKKIKIVLTDVDGCLTDATVLYTSTGKKIKKFCIYDGMAVTILKEKDILSGIISSDNSLATRKRAEDLNMNFIYVGEKNKVDILNEVAKISNVSLNEIAYMGDDIQDIDVLSKVGFSACPSNAIEDVKKIVNYITKKQGGAGAYREFVEYIIRMEGE